MKQIFKILFLLLYISIQAQEKNGKQTDSKSYIVTDSNSTLSSSDLKLSSGLNQPIKYDGNFESLNPSVISQISEIKFENRNLIHLLTDKNNNFYLFNLSVLEDSFERIYFFKGIVKLNFFIQIDHGLPSNVAWIISENKNENKITYSQIEKLITETKAVSIKMSKSEKENWLSNKSN